MTDQWNIWVILELFQESRDWKLDLPVTNVSIFESCWDNRKRSILRLDTCIDVLANRDDLEIKARYQRRQHDFKILKRRNKTHRTGSRR
jgi:hypothetical protein